MSTETDLSKDDKKETKRLWFTEKRTGCKSYVDTDRVKGIIRHLSVIDDMPYTSIHLLGGDEITAIETPEVLFQQMIGGVE